MLKRLTRTLGAALLAASLLMPTAGEYVIDVYAIMADGIYLYEPRDHKLVLINDGDHRELASKKPGFPRTAPLNLVYVAYTGDMKKSPHASDATKQARYLGVAAGTMAQSVALVLEAEGLGGCVRGSVDGEQFRLAAELNDDQEIILAQTIGAIK
ncbi:MAG: nitroreductase family protein [Selenomonadaceae bacterium]|nr:nitroreductase family protein [Selenomonadaceae bacterium]